MEQPGELSDTCLPFLSFFSPLKIISGKAPDVLCVVPTGTNTGSGTGADSQLLINFPDLLKALSNLAVKNLIYAVKNIKKSSILVSVLRIRGKKKKKVVKPSNLQF